MFINKLRRFRKSRLRGVETSTTNVFIYKGSCGLKVLENGYITLNQLEACRKSIKNFIQKTKKLTTVLVRAQLSVSRSKKKKGLRMGASKGDFSHFVYRAKKGSILLEITGVLDPHIIKKLENTSYRLPVQTAVVWGR